MSQATARPTESPAGHDSSPGHNFSPGPNPGPNSNPGHSHSQNPNPNPSPNPKIDPGSSIHASSSSASASSPSTDASPSARELSQAIIRRIFAPDPLVIVISGPSGVGKDETINHMQARGRDFHFVVTATTRPRREGETDGVDYHFVSMEQFAEMIDEDELLEYAVVYGDYKGIPKQQVRDALSSGKDVVLRIDVQGARTMKQILPDAIFIFLMADSMDELERRLRERKTEPADKLRMRIATARQEMRRVVEFDYVVVNHRDQLDKTVDFISAIIKAEKHRVEARKRIEL